MIKKASAMLSMLLFAGSLWAEDGVDAPGKDVVITPTGYGAFEVGQIVSGIYRLQSNSAFNIYRIWQERALCNIGLQAMVKNRLEINLAGEGMIAFSFPQIGVEPLTLKPRDFFYIKRAFASVKIGNPDNPILKVHAGLFPYKYNPDVRNLGEYMFRSAAYPPVLYADFDYPQANLLGARLELNLFDKMITNDLLFHSELYGIPTQDFSLSDVVNFNIKDIVNIGLGGSLNHWFSVYQGSGYKTNWSETYYYDLQRAPETDRGLYTIVKNGDTTYFSWRSMKAMARLSFDPKKLFNIPVFGENDLRLYSEVAVLGLEDIYALNYKYLEDRTIFTTGFNFPGFKFVDLLNLELEYCSNTRYAYTEQTYYSQGGQGPNPSPIPVTDGSTGLNPTGYQINPWKWSIYIKKTFFDGHLGLIAQAARDHKKINFYYFQKTHMSFDETLPNGNNWWWAFKTEFKF
jgi:hypothetical protein